MDAPSPSGDYVAAAFGQTTPGEGVRTLSVDVAGPATVTSTPSGIACPGPVAPHFGRHARRTSVQRPVRLRHVLGGRRNVRREELRLHMSARPRHVDLRQRLRRSGSIPVSTAGSGRDRVGPRFRFSRPGRHQMRPSLRPLLRSPRWTPETIGRFGFRRSPARMPARRLARRLSRQKAILHRVEGLV